MDTYDIHIPAQVHQTTLTNSPPLPNKQKRRRRKIRNLVVIVIVMQVFRFGDQSSKLVGNHI